MSNMYEVNVEYKGQLYIYTSAEQAYCCAKVVLSDLANRILLTQIHMKQRLLLNMLGIAKNGMT